MHVYAKNEHSVTQNNKKLKYIDREVYACIAYENKKDIHTNLVNINFPANPHKTCSLLNILNVKVGARVMLTTIIDVIDGLPNAAMGTGKIGCDATGNSKYKHINAIVVPIK